MVGSVDDDNKVGADKVGAEVVGNVADMVGSEVVDNDDKVGADKVGAEVVENVADMVGADVVGSVDDDESSDSDDYTTDSDPYNSDALDYFEEFQPWDFSRKEMTFMRRGLKRRNPINGGPRMTSGRRKTKL